MKKRKILILMLFFIALLLIGFGLWLFLSSKKTPVEPVYDKEYACDLLSKRDNEIIVCDLMQTENEYLILGVKKVEDQYEAFYRFELASGNIEELPMNNIQTG